jgi:Micrococcal nuclease (thermonuclease) homologs
MGLLIIDGVLRVKQFWPESRSDADTATVDLVTARPFVFINKAGHRIHTSVFDNAESVGKFGRKTVIKRTKGGGRHVTIRLQGLDAPELHFQPQVPGTKGKGVNHPFRQSMGETCANALHAFVTGFGLAEIPCEVLTVVEKPSDVCDVFGRVVGNIVLVMGGTRIDINQWLVREGWALPGFYNSMTKTEIVAVLTENDAAKAAKRGLFSKKNIVSTKLATFDPQRRERKGPSSFQPFSDRGTVNFPKYFRRQAERYVRAAIGQNVPSDLKGFIRTKPDDLALPRKEFLKLKPPTTGNAAKAKFRQLAGFLGKNRVPIGPELVYFENDSKLVKAGTNIEITKF